MSATVETGLVLDGLRCAGCALRVERTLGALPGVGEARVTWATQRALVRHDPERIDAAALAEAIAELGYKAVPCELVSLEARSAPAARRALVRLLVAGFLAGNVMVVAIALYAGSYEGMDAGLRAGLRWLALALSLPAATWCAAPFWRGAWSGLLRRELTIDVPVVLGIATAFGVGVIGTWRESEHVFADSAAVIVFLILLARTLERGARERANDAVTRLLARSPRTALRLDDAADEAREVPVDELVRGDRVLVPAGQDVPADGVLLCGASEFDEALLSGESAPVVHEVGDDVVAGARNLLCEVAIEVRAPANEGTVARLARLLERAQAERPRIQRIADRVASVFAPAVLAVAAGTVVVRLAYGASGEEAALAAAAVLIVACPCALALATPAALTAALGRAARRGLLFQSGEALERCARVSRVLLDKTGTLSAGRPEVVAVDCAPGEAERDVLACAADVEGGLRHPFADALRRAAGVQPGASDQARQVLAGRGVVRGDDLVGSAAFFRERGVRGTPEIVERARQHAERGRSVVCVARGGAWIGVIALEDRLRPDAAEAVARLRALGIAVELHSGDHEVAVARAAAAAGISTWYAQAQPEDKLEAVSRARSAEGDAVLFAGDGLNDAAALAAADVGVAFAHGADATVHAAHVVVHADRLAALPETIELSRATLARVRENLAFAIAYNVVAVPLAGSGWLEPALAAAAMGLSSLLVTGNALRLLRFGREATGTGQRTDVAVAEAAPAVAT